MTLADLVFEPRPLRLLRVLVLLSGIAMLSTRAPVLVAALWFAARALLLAVALRPRTFPSPLAAPVPRLTRCVARIKELTALEPLHDRRIILLPEAIQGRQQFLRVMRAERCRLVVDQDCPIGMARRHP
jgi:hypothetical protein